MKKTNKVLSIILAVLMIFTALPMTVSAEDGNIELGVTKSVSIADDSVKVEFTPTESGKYALLSDNSKDYSVDPHVMVYDSDNNLVAQGDDEGREANFYCIFEAVANSTYYVYLGAYQENVEYDYMIKRYVEITHQPTKDEPYVELNWDIDADYQWYSVDAEYGEVTDENAIGRFAHDVGPATYDEENGWTGAAYDEFEANYFQIEMLAGQEIELIPDEDVNCICIWSFDGIIHTLDVSSAGESVYFTAEADDTYFVFTEGNVNAHIKAYTDNIVYTSIESATDSEIQLTENGKYRCFVTVEDGTVVESDVFTVTGLIKGIQLDETYTVESDESIKVPFIPKESGKYVVASDNYGDANTDPYVSVFDSDDNCIAEDDDNLDTYNFYCIFEAKAGEVYYIHLGFYNEDTVEYDYVVKKYVEITHQPTADETYVELSWDVDADYQWYSVTSKYTEVSNDNARCRYVDGVGYAKHDNENGWTGVPYDKIGASFFAIEMIAGQTIEMIPDGDVDCLGIWSEYSNELCKYDVPANKSVKFTAEANDIYYVYTEGNNDAHLRAYTDIYSYTAIVGATDSEFQPKTNGEYRCFVKLGDETIVKSDIFEITGLTECDCACHAGGLKAFFFKIINFILSLFNPGNKTCACGLPH